jgi:3-methyladenine DNA glycosylase AlkD
VNAEHLTSATTAAAQAFVLGNRTAAHDLGRSLAGLVDDPGEFALALDIGLRRLADPVYAEGTRRVTPGIGPVLGVRTPLLDDVVSSLARGSRGIAPAQVLVLADRLEREPVLEPRWLAFRLLDRTIAVDPERTWQLMRRAAGRAGDWITVDRLAEPYSRGVLLERHRWSELEQLTYARSMWERRLVGSAIARMPFEPRDGGRGPEVARRGLEVVGSLIGDAEPNVQKALAWALRSLALVDRPAVGDFCRREATRAAESDDGHRAWVLRDAAAKLDRADADTVNATLAGIRRHADRPSTSEAAAAASLFIELPASDDLPDPLAPVSAARGGAVGSGAARDRDPARLHRRHHSTIVTDRRSAP